MKLWGGRLVGGRAQAGELAGRAVLVVPLDGIWELHDLPWDGPEDDCNDSYWEDNNRTLNVIDDWQIDWVDASHIEAFIAQHFADLDAKDLAHRFAGPHAD